MLTSTPCSCIYHLTRGHIENIQSRAAPYQASKSGSVIVCLIVPYYIYETRQTYLEFPYIFGFGPMAGDIDTEIRRASTSHVVRGSLIWRLRKLCNLVCIKYDTAGHALNDKVQ